MLFASLYKDWKEKYGRVGRPIIIFFFGILTPNGHMTPFCTYNTMGNREQVRGRLRKGKTGKYLDNPNLLAGSGEDVHGALDIGRIVRSGDGCAQARLSLGNRR